ncbi:uncharacterized protein BDW70DRAFT_110524 [Aspergillus foveolatus]|uniref:uncharacterized protein n=1 Tax=Aspergillus foveolatus TaxID=210207 RepID=UPI003CCD9102
MKSKDLTVSRRKGPSTWLSSESDLGMSTMRISPAVRLSAQVINTLVPNLTGPASMTVSDLHEAPFVSQLSIGQGSHLLVPAGRCGPLLFPVELHYQRVVSKVGRKSSPPLLALHRHLQLQLPFVNLLRLLDGEGLLDLDEIQHQAEGRIAG